jgi:hypothetical protein
MLAGNRQIVDLDIVVRLATDRGSLLAQGDFLEHRGFHAEYELSHCFRPSKSLNAALLEPGQETGPPAARSRIFTLHLDQDYRNIVTAAVVVGHLNQLRRAQLQVRRKRPSVMAISSSSTMSLRPSEQNR